MCVLVKEEYSVRERFELFEKDLAIGCTVIGDRAAAAQRWLAIGCCYRPMPAEATF